MNNPCSRCPYSALCLPFGYIEMLLKVVRPDRPPVQARYQATKARIPDGCEEVVRREKVVALVKELKRKREQRSETEHFLR